MDTFFQFKFIVIEFEKQLVGEPPISHKPVWAVFFSVSNIGVISFNDIQYYMY